MYETKEQRLYQALVQAKAMSKTPKETVGHFTEMVDYDEAVELTSVRSNASDLTSFTFQYPKMKVDLTPDFAFSFVQYVQQAKYLIYIGLLCKWENVSLWA